MHPKMYERSFADFKNFEESVWSLFEHFKNIMHGLFLYLVCVGAKIRCIFFLAAQGKRVNTYQR